MSVLDPFNLIIGFDTEYVRISEKDNRIVSLPVRDLQPAHTGNAPAA